MYLTEFVPPPRYRGSGAAGSTRVLVPRPGVTFDSRLVGRVPDQGDDHAVQVEEEQDEMKAELRKRFLLVNVQLPEDLGRIKEMGVVHNLLNIVPEEREVEYQRQPVSVDKEQERQESVDGDFRDDVGVEAVAEIDGVDVVTFQVAVHDGEEDLQEEIDGIYKHGEEV
jgi:hypothetical protein